MTTSHTRLPKRNTATASLRILALTLVTVVSTACAGVGVIEKNGRNERNEKVEAATTSPTIAHVDGHRISAQEVDARIKQDLFEEEFGRENQASALYDARKAAAGALVDEYLLERAAELQGVSPEDWVEEQLAALPPVSDEEVAAFFEEHRERIGQGVEYQAASQRIRTFLEYQRVDQIQEQLRAEAEVRFVLPRRRFEVAASGPSLGPDDAPITIVEFSDYQCPFCARAEPTLKELLARYPTQIRIFYRHLPLSFHPLALGAAKAAVCADDQDHFWAYHDLLFVNQKKLERDDLLGYARVLDLDVARFDACVDDEATALRVQEDFDAARSLGATGTPAFFINGIMLTGAQPVSAFESVIDEELLRLQPGS
jgi:predicted DsbA family dithiol-disulfide isomerase